MTRQAYQGKIRDVYDRIFRMGTSANDALRKALHAFSEGDADLARNVKERDASIDRMQEEIDRTILVLIAMEQPVARDLSELFASSKIVVELERLADHAAHIAKAVLKLTRTPPPVFLELTARMGELCVGMLDSAMSAFMARDTTLARETAARDDGVDALHREAVRFLLSRTEPAELENTMNLLLAARYLERIGDHVTNVCEWILYGADAAYVRLND